MAKLERREKERLTVYPAPRSLAVIGASSVNCNLALEIFGGLLSEAIRQNEDLLTRAEWCYLCDLLNGTMITSEMQNSWLTVGIAEGAELEGLAEKWLHNSGDLESFISKIRALDTMRFWAVIWVVRRFWERCEEIDLSKDEFWILKNMI